MPASEAPPAPASPRATGAKTPETHTRVASPKRIRIASTLGLGVGGLAYFLTLFNYQLSPVRGATAFGYAGQFFELQADAIRDGHLRVPTNSLGIEGFVVDGHTYSYFGIFPALLRMPVQLITHEFDGRLTLLSMAIAWVVFAVMTTRLYWSVRKVLRPTAVVGRGEALLAVVFLAAATGGTTITFDAALPWAYHEVYLWSIASVVGALYWLLRTMLEPTTRHVRWLLVFVLVASLTRTTGGWAVCLVTIAAGLFYLRRQDPPAPARTWVGVALAGLVPLLVGILINYLKFQHPFLFPLENQVFTEVNQHRREVLAQNGGTLAGIQFLPSSLINYFSPEGVRFTGYFPWLSLPATPASGYNVELDQGYRTGSVPAFMPLLFLLTVASIPMLFRRLPTFGHRAVRLVFVGAFLMTGGVMDYGYIANRYTSEFVPVLVVGGMVALHSLAPWTTREHPRLRLGLLVVAAVLTAYSVALQMAVGHTAAATTYKGPKLESYLQRQVELSGSTAAYARLVRHGDGLPTGGNADDLWIRGDCDALYFNTGGDDRTPWMLVQERDTALNVRMTRSVRPGMYALMSHTTDSRRTVSIRVASNHQAQLVIVNGGFPVKGQLFDLPPDAEIRVGARALSEFGAAEVRSTPGGLAGHLTTAQWDDAKQRTVLSSVVADSSTVVRKQGLSIAPAATLPLDLCRNVARAAGVQTSAAD